MRSPEDFAAYIRGDRKLVRSLPWRNWCSPYYFNLTGDQQTKATNNILGKSNRQSASELKTNAWALCDTRETQDLPKTLSHEKVGEIAAEFLTTFYHLQVGALETQEFRTKPVPFWLAYFSDMIKGLLRQMFFAVLLPDGTIIEPRVTKRL